MKVLHFGAGNIGRGFISPILKKDSNIKAIKFVEVNQNLVNQINSSKQYYVNEMGNKITKVLVTDISATTPKDLFNQENQTFLEEVTLVTTAIGQNNLHFIADSIIKLIKIKQNLNLPLIIICCENGNRVSTYFKNMLNDNVNFKNIYFVDAVVDRIVPNQNNSDLTINVEQYYSWIVDINHWPKTITKITSITYSNKIENEINKKLCFLNGVHAAIAWHRYAIDQFKIKTIQNALKEKITKIFVADLYHELIVIISKKYHFSQAELTAYKNQLLLRFTNKYLVDDLARIGRNPITKLQKNERILLPLLFAIKHNLNHQRLLETFNNGLNYRGLNDSQAQQIATSIKENGKEKTVKTLIKGLTNQEYQTLIMKK